ncbi:leucine-rich repeat protein [Artemisia annua]|uniref:Leucine-rich repeat protein n=1 Tax=Artemisia annua TaxID=35608 RepID=A0A2U1LCE2_ARTAN|nr:leucine-rich repeat protein [Artemisia annua]
MSAFSFSHFSSFHLRILFVVLLFHSCLSNQNSDDALCIKEERQALLEFKHRLIDEGNRLSSWVDEKNDCCKWAGIVCDNMTGHVHHIHLRALNGILTSRVPISIPPQLGNISQLHTLCLGSFQDDEWGESTSVVNMEWLSNLRLLHHLDMSNVDLSKLQWTQIAMDWFEVINTLPCLAELHLRNSYLFDAHPHIPALNITSLTLLDLSRNQFTNSLVPQWIFSITSLFTLELSGCDFNGLIPSSSGHSFRNLTSLKWLHVSWNTFMNSSLVLNELSSGIGSNLLLLDISHCDILSTALDSLHNLTSLLSLDLSWNQLTNIIPKSLVFLNANHLVCYLTHIQILDLSNNKLMGDIPKCFNKFKVLSGKETISDDQFYIPTSGKAVIGSDSLVMKGHEYIYNTNLKLVRLLDLSSNNLVGHIPSELTTLIKLQSLNLSGNHLTGRIPEKIGALKELESFDLSLNNLSGELPISLSSLNLLSSFNVSYNNLTGKIPSSTQLQSLNESCFVGNELCGDPLSEPCSRVEAPDTNHEEDDGSHGVDWGLIISIVSGLIVGFWVIVAPPIVSRLWRIAYFSFLSELGYIVYDFTHKMFSR